MINTIPRAILCVCLVGLAPSNSFSQDRQPAPAQAPSAEKAPPPQLRRRIGIPTEALRAEQQILAVLERRIEFEAQKQSLPVILTLLAKQLQIPLDLNRVDWKGHAGIVSIPKQHRTARAILDGMLDRQELAWEIRNGSLTITHGAGGSLETRFYDVSDLVRMREADAGNAGGKPQLAHLIQCMPPRQENAGEGHSTGFLERGNLFGGTFFPGPIPPKKRDDTSPDFPPVSLVATAPDAKVLIVLQTQPAHHRIERLLNDLARSAAAQGERVPAVSLDHQDDPDLLAEERIFAALEREIEFEAKDLPPKELFAKLADQLQIPIDGYFHEPKAEEDFPPPLLTIRKHRRTARSVLEQVTTELGLLWTIRHQALIVGDEYTIDHQIEARVYNVPHLMVSAPLVEGDPGEPHKPEIPIAAGHELIPASMSLPLFKFIGRKPLVYTDHGAKSLVVHQTPEGHERVRRLLNELTAQSQKQGLAEPRYTPVEERILKALNQELEFEAVDEPVMEAFARLENELQTPIEVNEILLLDEGQPLDRRVTLSKRRRSVPMILTMLLDAPALTWEIRYETLLITHRLADRLRVETRLYDVSDLMISPELGDNVVKRPLPLPELMVTFSGDENSDEWALRPDGHGSLVPVLFTAHGGATLIVQQTRAGHREIEQFLDELAFSITPRQAAPDSAEVNTRKHRGVPISGSRSVVTKETP